MKSLSPIANFQIAVVGATGNVGREFLALLSELNIDKSHVHAVASAKSKGKQVSFGDKGNLTVESLEDFDFNPIDLVLSSAGAEVSKKFAPRAVDAQALVIDNSSAFRMDPNVPLIVPEVNIDSAKDWKKSYIIANPNCSTIQTVVALQAVHKLFKIKHVSASTYQSVSGSGKSAMDELFQQTKNVFVNQSLDAEDMQVYPRSIAFNIIPHIDNFMDDETSKNEDITKEEWKMRVETKKILDPSIQFEAICVRVPVFISHAVSLFVECKNNIDTEKLRHEWEESFAISLAEAQNYTTPKEAARSDFVHISRLRKFHENNKALAFWCVSDNLLKGAALNALQIAEQMASLKWITPKAS